VWHAPPDEVVRLGRIRFHLRMVIVQPYRGRPLCTKGTPPALSTSQPFFIPFLSFWIRSPPVEPGFLEAIPHFDCDFTDCAHVETSPLARMTGPLRAPVVLVVFPWSGGPRVGMKRFPLETLSVPVTTMFLGRPWHRIFVTSHRSRACRPGPKKKKPLCFPCGFRVFFCRVPSHSAPAKLVRGGMLP